VQQVEEQTVRMSTSDLILIQQKELGKRMDQLDKRIDQTRDELGKHMDRLETRMDKLESRMDKQDEKIDRLADKIDELRRDLMTGSNHGQISTITTIGIALAVIYSVLR